MAPAWLTQPKLSEAVKRKNPFSFIKPDGTTDLLPDEYDEAIALFKHGMDGHSYDDFIEEQNRKLKLRDQYFRALWGEDYREKLGAGEEDSGIRRKESERDHGKDFDMEKARNARRPEQGTEGSYLDLIRSGTAPSLTAGMVDLGLLDTVKEALKSKLEEKQQEWGKYSLYGDEKESSSSIVPRADGELFVAVDPTRGFDENGNMIGEWMDDSEGKGCYFGGVFIDCWYHTGNKTVKINIAQTPEAREALLDDDYRKAFVEMMVDRYAKVAAEDGRRPLWMTNESLDLEIEAHIKVYEAAKEELKNPNASDNEKYVATWLRNKCEVIDIGGTGVEWDRIVWDELSAPGKRYEGVTDIDPFPFNVD